MKSKSKSAASATLPPAIHGPLAQSQINSQVRKLIDEVEAKLPPSASTLVTDRWIDPAIRQPWMTDPPAKRCIACLRYKEYRHFDRNDAFPDRYESVCKVCRPADAEPSPEPPSLAGTSVKVGRRARGREHSRVRRLLAAAVARAARQRMAFDLYNFETELELKLQLGKCEFTGTPFCFHTALAPDAPSLYLLDPAKGFVYTNVRVICWAMNCALGTWGPAVLEKILAGWKR